MAKKNSQDKSIEKVKKKVLKIIKMSEKEDSDEKIPVDTDINSAGPEKTDIPLTAKEEKKRKKLEKKQQKKAKKKSRKLPVRILIFLAKTLFLRIPAVIIILVAIALIGVKIYLSPSRVQGLIVTNFNGMSNGKIEMNVKEFSPYGGFVIEDIVIYNGPEFNSTVFVKMKRLAIKYGLFPMLIGNVRIPEIGIYKPEIYLEEKNGVWNAAKLMKPGEKKEPEKKEPEKKEEAKKDDKKEPPMKEISLPVAAEFLFKFVLDDLKMYVKGSKFKSSVEGLTFSLDIDIPPFKKIPLSVEAVSLLKNMSIVLNPKEEMKVSFISDEAEASPPLVLTWKLLFSNEKKDAPQFNSIFKLGMYNTPVRFKNIYLTPLNFMVSYDLFYNPVKDHLTLNHLGVEFHGKKWIYLTGAVENVTKKQVIDLKMKESDISLGDLHPYFRSVTNDYRTFFGGNISLAPLTIKGDPDNIDIDGNVTLKGVSFSIPGTSALIPYLNISYLVLKRSDDMIISSNIVMPHLYYTLGKYKSGDNGFELKTDISAFNNFSRVVIRNFGVRLYSPDDSKNALDLAVSGDVMLKPQLAGSVSISKLQFNKPPLYAMVPEKFKKMLDGIPVSKPVDMNLGVNFFLGDIITAKLNMLVKVPDFQVPDLAMGLDVVYDKNQKVADLKSFTLGSKAWNADISASGKVDHKVVPISDADIKLSVKLNNPQMKQMQGPWFLGGLVDINAFVKGNLDTGKAYGSVKIEKLFVKNDEGKIYVDDMNMNFPFEFLFKYLKKALAGESQITITKEQVIDSQFFSEKPNFSIKSVRAKHPARDMIFEFVKDFEMYMAFKNNIFQIVNMKAYVLDGALYGRNILFNLSDFNQDNMEFKMILDITNVDIAKLDEPDPKKKTRDAELSLSANFSGRGLNVKKELKPVGYIEIYKIGEKFANKLMKGLSEEQGQSKLGVIGQFAMDNSMKVSTFNFNLDKGLVYATVTLSRGAIGYAFGVENNQIKFDRITVGEFLRKVKQGD